PPTHCIVSALCVSRIPPPAFFFLAPPPTAIYTLSLHDSLPIWAETSAEQQHGPLLDQLIGNDVAQLSELLVLENCRGLRAGFDRDRKSTRLNSSHVSISYAVFCLKKKTNNTMRRCSTTRLQTW